ncbi:hypothetical protein HC174_08860 [Salinimicrobium sp. CDJ15-81-2]|nr:hypothetical protein [Salinimicrobium nanhaiense]
MKSYKKYSLLQLIVLALIMTFSASDLFAQENKEIQLTEFLLVVQNSDNNKIVMECKEGCAWKTLSYNLSDNRKPQAIDEYGMTDLNKVNSQEDADLSNFLFTVERKGNRLNFKGVEGTAWTELSFSISPQQEQAINEMGMTE